jgi:hypothetical protein
MTRISVDVDVDLADLLEQVGEDALIKELEARCLEPRRKIKEAEERDFLPLVEEALDQLRSGRPDEARLTLERTLFPKWRSREDAEAALKARAA